MQFELNKIHNVDARVLLGAMESGSVDSIVTDPPAGISFMGKEWDHHKGGRDQWIAWMQEIAVECLRVLKPGGHALVWALPRTSHWTATAWENAGFDVRDRVAYLFGSGFPKSLDVSKATDKEAGAERKVVRVRNDGRGASPSKLANHDKGDTGIGHMDGSKQVYGETEASTDLARQWNGWGTALKPACEDWWLLRKPVEGTIAQNVAKYGTGAINIDECRIEGDAGSGVWGSSNKTCQDGRTFNQSPEGEEYKSQQHPKGRWPANVIHDGSEEVLALFPQTAPAKAGWRNNNNQGHEGWSGGTIRSGPLFSGHADNGGSAARFFYTAKASRSEREEGLDGLPERMAPKEAIGTPRLNDLRMEKEQARNPSRNHHPTVKPLALMEYLVRLITPPKGIVLDPFAGSGTTCGACIKQGFQFIACEKEAEYVAIAEKRIERWRAQGVLDFDQRI